MLENLHYIWFKKCNFKILCHILRTAEYSELFKFNFKLISSNFNNTLFTVKTVVLLGLVVWLWTASQKNLPNPYALNFSAEIFYSSWCTKYPQFNTTWHYVEKLKFGQAFWFNKITPHVSLHDLCQNSIKTLHLKLLHLFEHEKSLQTITAHKQNLMLASFKV